jgi:two-component system cell cycle sensor histidine kinase/response regulator CckA
MSHDEHGAPGAAESADRLELEDFLRDLWPELWFSMVDGISIVDGQGRFVLVSPSYCQLVGYAEEELVGESFLKIVPEDQRADYVAKFRRAMASPRSGYSGEFTLQRKDGRRITIHTRNTLLRDGERSLHAFVTRDTTEQRSLELQVMHADRIRALGTLAGGVAHEFNNLLVSILGYAEMIANLVPTKDREVRRFARKIQRAAKRGTQITGQLLPFARREEFHRETVDLHKVLREVAELYRLSSDRRVHVALKLGAPRAWVHANAIQLQQVFLNVFLNASDAMPDGGELTIATEARAAGAGDDSERIETRIADTGCGMDEDTRRRIFEPFFTTKKSGKGTGLGMALVFSTVASHGGTVHVESAPDQGTTVVVRLPIEREGGS